MFFRSVLGGVLLTLLLSFPLYAEFNPESPLYGFKMTRIDGSQQKLSDYKGQVLLIVNTASKCGLTPQYAKLQNLYGEYSRQGLTVLGFPANDFKDQEPGSDAEIAAFCKDNYSITFPMFSKISVMGKNQHPLYKWLTEKSALPGPVKWNFQKYLIDRKGRVIARFDPKMSPDDPRVKSAVSAALTDDGPNRLRTEGLAAAAISQTMDAAQKSGKPVFLFFYSLRDKNSAVLLNALKNKDASGGFRKYYEVGMIFADRMPDYIHWLLDYAKPEMGVPPFVVLLSPKGEILGKSVEPSGRTLADLTMWDQVRDFMTMLRKPLSPKAEKDMEPFEKFISSQLQQTKFPPGPPMPLP